MKLQCRYVLLIAATIGVSTLVVLLSWSLANNIHRHKQSTSTHRHQHSYLDRSLVDYSTAVHRSHQRCSLSSTRCFTMAKCDPTKGPVKVHVYPWPPTVQVSTTFLNLLSVVRQSPHFTDRPEEACLFISANHDTLDRDPLSPNFAHKLQPLADQGKNHLVFSLFTGSWPNYSELDFAHWSAGSALLAKASFSQSHYRRDFDVSLPLFSHLHPVKGQTHAQMNNLNNQALSARKHLLVFKGKRYTYGIGSETRNALHHLHHPPDIIILTTCKHGKKWQELRDERCDHDNQDYDSYDYLSLMINSSFCLVPRGRRLASFRFLESLEVSCVPVLLSNDWVLPFEDRIDWSRAAIRADERLLLQIPETLRTIDQRKLMAMRVQAQALYETYFSSIERIALTTLAILEERIFHERSRSAFLWNRVVAPGSLAGAFLFHDAFTDDWRRFPGFDNRSLGFTAVVRLDQPVASQVVVKLFRSTLLKSRFFKHLVIQVLTSNSHSLPTQILTHSSVSLVTESLKFPLPTDAVFYLNPQTILTNEELDFAYSVWLSFPHRVVGFVSRDHFFSHNRWLFSSKWSNQFSSVSLDAAVVHAYFLFLFGYLGQPTDECFHLSLMAFHSHWTREPPLKLSQRHSVLAPGGQSSSQMFFNSQQCLDRLVDSYGYMPLIHSQVRLDPVLFKDAVSMTRKKYKKMEINQ